MDYDDYVNYPGSLSPVAPAVYSRGGRRVEGGRPQPHDHERMRWEAWRLQKKAQRRRRWTDEERLQALVNTVAAADLDLAARGLPFRASLERDGGSFTIVLAGEAEEPDQGVVFRSDPFEISEVDPNVIGGVVSGFLGKLGLKL